MWEARRHRVVSKISHRGRLHLRRRYLPMSTMLPAMRQISAAALIAALLIAGYRFISQPYDLLALEFTPHVVGIETGAVGVLGIATADIDNDGDLEIATAGLDGVKVYIRQSGNTYEQKIVDSVKGERVQIIDLNKDGSLDLLVSLKEGPGVKWYRNTGNLEFSGTLVGSGDRSKAFAGDINADGAADIVTATTEGGVVVLRRLMNNGSGTFAATVLDASSGVSAVTIGDIDGNGYQDIITGGSGGLQNWDTSDGLSWTESDIDSGNNNGTHVVVADVNGDGRNDIVTGDQAGNVVAVYRHIEHSTFGRIALTGDADATTVQPVDIDEDGDIDIIVAAQDDNSIFWYDNDGSEEFKKQTVASGLQSVFAIAVADVDNDNDFDVIAGDHFRGTVWWYERTRAKPKATEPTNISQTTDGAGRITLDTTVSDGDLEPTKIRVQYSVDGDHWYKPWLIAAKPAAGKVDLKNSHAYQVGTANAIDTNTNASVKLTLTWDTKSVQNTGGPIVGDQDTVQIRVIPKDDSSTGLAAYSAAFRVDNQPPQGLGGVKFQTIGENEVTLSWTKPSDSSPFSYKLYYGTDHAKVLEQKSDVWDNSDDPALNDLETTTTTITGLESNKTYTFKLFAKDAFGNQSAAPSVRGTSTAQATPSPTIVPTGVPEPTPQPTQVSPTPSITPVPTAATPTPSPLPTVPPTTQDNAAPEADAGLDQVVNPSALVILDGGASFDSDGDILSYVWRQLSGPSVDLVSGRTATPSFSAANENATYIFTLTVQDSKGASATDIVTVATKALPAAATTPVATTSPRPEVPKQEPVVPAAVTSFLQPLDLFLFVLAALSTALSLLERAARALRDRRSKGTALTTSASSPKGTVVHFKTGDPIAGARVMIYGADGKLRSTERTNAKGEFSTLFPAGQYTIGVEAPGFIFSPAASRMLKPEAGILYAGGKITVPDSSRPLSLLVPMKPTGLEVSSIRTRVLHTWQNIQRIGRILSWPIFIIGAFTNTLLIFWVPSGLFLTIEILYVVLVIVKVALEVRVRPAYGLVRDAITHVPLDLAVVRLFEQGTNRLVMTRVTNAQGKFFALPPAGNYMVTVTKPGYATFSKDNVAISSEQDSVLQITTDLMPVVPPSGLQAVRAAVL